MCGFIFANQLILAALVIHRNTATRNQRHTIRQPKFEIFHGTLEHHAAQLGSDVLEGKIAVPGRGVGKVGYFTLHPELLEVFLKHATEQSGQPTDREDGFFREDVQKRSSLGTLY